LLPLREPDESGSKLPHSRKALHAHHLANAFFLVPTVLRGNELESE
jgi:hypothetical protein